MPRHPKPAHLRQNRERRDLGPVSRFAGDTPQPPKNLLKASRQAWEAFWGSDMAGTVATETDLPALSRLFSLYDERLRAYREFCKARMVTGSTGQPVVNPLAKFLATVDSEIRHLEDRFGLSPMARLKLGVIFGDAHRSLDEMNRRLDAEDAAELKVVSPAVDGA